jgi:hypothetical protein
MWHVCSHDPLQNFSEESRIIFRGTTNTLTAGIGTDTVFGFWSRYFADAGFCAFFPVHMAVAATAGVHGANNIFKILVVGKNADRDLVLGFGIPAIMAAFAGVMIGKRWMYKVTMSAVQWLTGCLLLAIALALGAGII